MSDNTTEHVHACEFPEHTEDKQDFGCHCACGAILHWLGWQKPKTQEAAEPTLLPVNPCKVVLEEDPTLGEVDQYHRGLRAGYSMGYIDADNGRDPQLPVEG